MKTRIEEQLAKLRDALKGDDVAAITSSTDALQQVWHEAAAALYQQASPGAETASSATEAPPEGKKPGGGDGAVDADFEVLK